MLKNKLTERSKKKSMIQHKMTVKEEKTRGGVSSESPKGNE